jgi:cytochrome P450
MNRDIVNLFLKKKIEPIAYGDYVIPAGHMLCISPGMSHQIDSTFPEANKVVV